MHQKRQRKMKKFYDRSHKSYNCTLSEDAANHIVTIVGWNDNYSRDKFGEASKPKRNGAWIIKTAGETRKKTRDIPIYLMKIDLCVNFCQVSL